MHFGECDHQISDMCNTPPLILVMATIAIHCHLSSVLDVLGDVLFFLLFFSEWRCHSNVAIYAIVLHCHLQSSSRANAQHSGPSLDAYVPHGSAAFCCLTFLRVHKVHGIADGIGSELWQLQIQPPQVEVGTCHDSNSWISLSSSAKLSKDPSLFTSCSLFGGSCNPQHPSIAWLLSIEHLPTKTRKMWSFVGALCLYHRSSMKCRKIQSGIC